MAEKQTAGRDHLGKLAPKFAEFNDDVLFGEVWSREAERAAPCVSFYSQLAGLCGARSGSFNPRRADTRPGKSARRSG